MKARTLVTLFLLITCGAVLWGVITQGREISELRIEKTRLEVTNSVTAAPPESTDVVPSPRPEVPRELLQLRAEVARLSQQQHVLAGARAENEKLRLQLENRRTNSAAAGKQSGAYIRTSEARWLGCNTPEDTLQSFLWAVQNRNSEKLLETIPPDQAKKWTESGTLAFDEMFNKKLPSVFMILTRQQNNDGSFELHVTDNDRYSAESLVFRQFGGQWRLDSLR